MKFASKAKLISLHKNYMKNLQLRLLISILAKYGPMKKNSYIPTHNLRGYCLVAIFINSIISVHIIFIMLDAAFFDI